MRRDSFIAGATLRLVALLAFLGVVIHARAHGPYDSSAQVIVFADSLEARATLGMDGAKQVLLNAGLAEAEATDALAPRGPSTPADLPLTVVPHLFELIAGGKALNPQHVRVITDGLEASFTATYAGPPPGELEFRARYFDNVEAMKPGAFVVLDENRMVKRGAMLSRSKPSAVVTLTTPAAAPTAVEAVPAQLRGDATNAVSTPAPVVPASGSRRSLLIFLWAGGVLAMCLVLFFVLKSRRQT